MGYNTPILVLNDDLYNIRKDDRFGEKIVTAIRHDLNEGHVDVSGYGGAVKVFPSFHADELQIYAIGANSMIKLGAAYYKDDIKTILKKLADQHGFSLVKKKKKLKLLY